MKKIDCNARNALLSRGYFNQSNTTVMGGGLYLHGHKIAWFEGKELFINLCGWNTLTTRARLNALPGVCLKQKAERLFLNGEEISSRKTYKIS